jgi:hypothetical protein
LVDFGARELFGSDTSEDVMPHATGRLTSTNRRLHQTHEESHVCPQDSRKKQRLLQRGPGTGSGPINKILPRTMKYSTHFYKKGESRRKTKADPKKNQITRGLQSSKRQARLHYIGIRVCGSSVPDVATNSSRKLWQKWPALQSRNVHGKQQWRN